MRRRWRRHARQAEFRRSGSLPCVRDKSGKPGETDSGSAPGSSARATFGIAIHILTCHDPIKEQKYNYRRKLRLFCQIEIEH